MEPVTSVEAFVSLYHCGEDDVAADIFGRLDPEEQLALRAWRVNSEGRLEWLRRNSDFEWTPAKLERIELRASLHLRRELQRRGLWRG